MSKTVKLPLKGSNTLYGGLKEVPESAILHLPSGAVLTLKAGIEEMAFYSKRSYDEMVAKHEKQIGIPIIRDITGG